MAPFWPPDYIDNAGALHVRHRVNALQEFCDVTLITQAGWDASPYDLGVKRDVRLATLPIAPKHAPVGRALSFAGRSLAGELTPGRAVVRAWTEQLGAEVPCLDVIEVHWSQHFSMVDPLRRLYPQAHLVAYAHDVMTQALRRRAAGSPSTLRRVMARVAATRAGVREPRLLNKFDSVSTFSAKDGALIEEMGVSVPIRVEQLYFDLPQKPAPLKGSTVVFVGAMYRPENDQAARWLVAEIWPKVVAAAPEAELLIVGSGPSVRLQELASRQRGVQVVGYVRDLASVYHRAAVVLVPLIVGAGIKLKVIEALASGVPVIATPVGAEGIPDSLFGGISAEAPALARLTVDVLRDDVVRQRLGSAGRSWARDAHSILDTDVAAAVERYRRAAAARRRRGACSSRYPTGSAPC